MKKTNRWYKRILAFFLAVMMLFSAGAISAFLGIEDMPKQVEAANAYDAIFSTMVSKNITDRLKFNYNTVYTSDGAINGNLTISETALSAFHNYESKCFPTSLSFSQEEVLAAINNNKADTANYSAVNVPDTMKTLLNKYVFYLMDADSKDASITETDNPNYSYFISANTFYGTPIGGYDDKAKEYQAKMATANPWESSVIAYDNSPLSPGYDYGDQSMSSSYTIGQLIVDYLHANYTPSGLVADDRIISLYDNLATNLDSPFVDMEELEKLILADVNAGNVISNADRNYTQMLKTDEMVTYRDYVLSLPADSPIPSGTLFIGTWLMDAQSITEPFYQMAVQSMTTYNQQVMLYKSELSSGYWKNIYGASGLDDILPVADNVPEYQETTEEATQIAGLTVGDSSGNTTIVTQTGMANYYIDIVVGKDGIPRKAKTGAEVDVFSLTDPYSLDNLPELTALKAMVDGGVVSANDPSDSKKYLYYEVSRFFEYDTSYDYTVTDIYDPNYTKTVTVSKGDFQTACDYILSCANKTDIAFYAQDPQRDRRMEQSGYGFLNSLELTADTPAYRDGWLHYNYQGHSGYSGRKLYISRLMVGNDDGTFGWKGENDWIAEIRSLPKSLDTFNRYSQIFRKVWIHKSQIHDDVTNVVDSRMNNIRGLYRELCLTGTAEDKELAYEAINVENSLDSLRRYEAYYNLVENEKLNFYVGPPLLFLYECVTEGSTALGCDFNQRWNTDEQFTPEDAVTNAVEEAIVACTDSMYKYEQQALMPGTAIVSQTEYDLSNKVIDNAPSGAANVRPILRQLVDLDNITKNVIAHKTRELSMINNTLLPTADSKFASYVHENAGEDYQRAAAYSTTTQDALNEILKDQQAGVSSVAAELQVFIKAKAMRLSTEEAIAFIYERIDRAESLRAGITTDAFGKYASEALDDHIRWLQELLATVSEGGSLDEDGVDYDISIESYEAQLLDALNNGDLQAAEEVERKLAEASRRSEEAEKAGRDVINDPNASAAQKAEASDPNTPSGVADKIYDDAKQRIEDNDWDKLKDDIEALKDLGSPKLENLLPDLEGKGAPASVIHQVEKAIQEIPDSDFADHYGTTPTGDFDPNSVLGNRDTDGNPIGPNDTTDPNANGDGTGGNNSGTGTGGLDTDKINMAIEEALGVDPNDLTGDDGAAVIAALTSYEDVHGGEDSDLDKYIQSLLQDLLDSHSTFIYRQYLEDDSREYVSLAAVSRCRKYTKFRLVEKEGISTMSQIAGGSASYGFEVGEKGVVKNNGAKEKMDTAAVSQADESLYGNKMTLYPYISEASSGKYLYCTCAYIKNTEWAVLITPATDKKIAQLLDLLDVYGSLEP